VSARHPLAAAVALATIEPAPEPTPEQLQLAYRQLARPDRWPPTLEQALAHPTLGICLRALARQLSRPRWTGSPVAPTMPGAWVLPTPTEPPLRKAQRPAGGAAHSPQHLEWRRRGIDLKRAAANDRDDD